MLAAMTWTSGAYGQDWTFLGEPLSRNAWPAAPCHGGTCTIRPRPMNCPGGHCPVRTQSAPVAGYRVYRGWETPVVVDPGRRVPVTQSSQRPAINQESPFYPLPPRKPATPFRTQPVNPPASRSADSPFYP